jgi:hypothetical protein
LKYIKSGGVNLVYEGRHLLGESVVLKTSLSYATRDNWNIPETGTTEIWFVDHIAGTFSGGPGERDKDNSIVTTATATGTWITGPHVFKAGLEYRDTRWYLDWNENYIDLAFTDGTHTDSIYSYVYDWAHGQVGTRDPSVFLQDSWLLTERLRINMGLRWDGQYLISSEGKVAQSILNEWQPRAGFTYQPGRIGSQKIFGSFGRFYQALSTWGMLWYYNQNSMFAVKLYDHDPRIDPTGGTGWEQGGAIQAWVDGMEGQYNDEYTLGYERMIGTRTTVGVTGVYRNLGQGIDDGSDSANNWQLNNYGRGVLSAFPHVKRQYKALEFSFRQEAGERLTILASYVLSRTNGNYPGLFNSDLGWVSPNMAGYDKAEGTQYWDGLLPNDRTHVFKISGSYRTSVGLTIGTTAFWESGTPMTDFMPSVSDYMQPNLIGQRGTAGRTPSVWDLNFRITYEPRFAGTGRWRPKLTADFLHLGNSRAPIGYDMTRYLNHDAEGNPIDPNPNYHNATTWQPPMYVRLGGEVQF